MTETPQKALSRAVKTAGGFTALGRKIGISGEAIMQWNPYRRDVCSTWSA